MRRKESRGGKLSEEIGKPFASCWQQMKRKGELVIKASGKTISTKSRMMKDS